MPLAGTLDVTSLLDAAPEMPDLGTEPMEIKGATVLQVMVEIESGPMLEMLPVALNPTIPPTLTFLFFSAKGSPIGDFQLAQVRVGSRAGVRPRGYLTRAFIDNMEAGRALGERWGFNCVEAEVNLQRYYDRAVGSVRLEGQTVLEAAMLDPEAIAGTDLQYVASMHLARVPSGGETKPRLVQVDPEFTFHKAERGRALVSTFDARACGEERARPVYPVSASLAVCDIMMPRIRYISDPFVPTLQGTEKVG
jgi:hypothetical protein